MRLALCFATALVLHSQTQPVPQDPEKARLEGMALNSASGEPLRKTRLTLRMNVAAVKDQRAEQPPQAQYSATSDATGRFAFANVEPGDYQLSAAHDGFATVRLGNLGNGKKTAPILFGRGDSKTDFTIKLVPYGAVAGLVLDEDGDPIRNLRISAMTWHYGSNGRELHEEKSAESNDLGEYRIFDLPPGRYMIKVNPRQLRMSGDQAENPPFAPAYYPGVAQVAGAIPQDVGPGQQLHGLTFNLRRARFATIRGRVVAPPDASDISAGLLVAMEGGSSSTSGTVDDQKTGKFEIRNVTSGSIYVTGSYLQAGQRYNTMQPVEVGTTDIEGLELRPLAPADLGGRVSVEGDPEFDVSKLGISLDGAFSGRHSEAPPSIGKDGRLAIHGVLPGKYRVALNRMQQLYIKSIHWGTADITDDVLDLLGGIPPRTELAIVLGADGGELTGVVKNENAEPVDSATVILVPGGTHRSRRFKTVTTDVGGRFTLRGIAPGSYRIFAWDRVDPNAVMYDPEFLRPYEAAGQNVEVLSKGKHTAELKLIINKDPDDRSR